MNKERIHALLEKIPVPLLFLAVIGYFGYDFWDFTRNETSPLAAKQNEVEAVSNELTKLSGELKRLARFREELESRKSELRALAQKLEALRSSLNETFDDAAFIKAATQEAQLAKLDVRAITKSGLPSKLKYYDEHKFDVNIRGVYFQVLLFLQRVALMSQLVNVDSINLHPTGQKVQAKYSLLEGRIVLKGYNYSRSEADKIGSPTTGGGK